MNTNGGAITRHSKLTLQQLTINVTFFGEGCVVPASIRIHIDFEISLTVIQFSFQKEQRRDVSK